MDREQRIDELRSWIVVLDLWRQGCSALRATDDLDAGRFLKAFPNASRGHVSCAGYLAEALAELSALEQREPTIEERFPIGSRWKMAPASVVRVVSRSDFERGSEERANQLPDGPKVFVFYEQSPSFKGGYSWDDGNELGSWVRIDDTAPTQPVEPPKPAPTCEAPGWIGPEHSVDADAYQVCRVCRASESDRRRERRRAFDRRYVAAVETVLVPHREEPEAPGRCEERWRAVLGSHAAIGPTESEAANALFEKMERAR